MQKVILSLSILVLFFCLPFVSFAYEAMEVKNGGSIEGIVQFSGVSVPKDEILIVTSDIEYCRKNLPAEKCLISAERRIKNVHSHPWQHAYVYIFDHPYAAVSDEKGEFAIKDVPPGIYTVEAWHEAMGKITLSNI